MNSDLIPTRLIMIENAVSSISGVPITDIRRHWRNANAVSARHAVWYIAVKHLRFYGNHVARMYGHDHSSVMHAINKLKENGEGELIASSVQKICPEPFEQTQYKKKYGSIHHWHVRQ